jgi:TusA-related sulfurtransferase
MTSNNTHTNANSGANFSATPVLDLRQVKCPLNFVKAKLALEKWPHAEPMLIDLANDLTMNVPKSLEQEGYTVTTIHADTAGLRIAVSKTVLLPT